MFDNLLQWDILQKILLNTLFVSIPEELFLVMFTLILVGEFDYWKEPECKRLIHKFDYVRILVPTVAGALLSNILRYTGIESGTIQIFMPIASYILIVLTNDIFGDANRFKWILKALIFYMIGILLIIISEFIYMPFILYKTGLTVKTINSNILMNFLLSLPSRAIQYSILIYFVSKKRTLLKGRMFRYILPIPTLSIILLFIILFNSVFFGIMLNSIVFNKALVNMPSPSQIFIITGIVVFPLFNIIGLFYSIYYVKNRELSERKILSNRLYIILKNIKLYTKNKNYDNITWKINEFSNGVEEIAKSLYNEADFDELKNRR